MSENPTFSPERALGDGLSALKRGELIELAIKLCEAHSANTIITARSMAIILFMS